MTRAGILHRPQISRIDRAVRARSRAVGKPAQAVAERRTGAQPRPARGAVASEPDAMAGPSVLVVVKKSLPQRSADLVFLTAPPSTRRPPSKPWRERTVDRLGAAARWRSGYHGVIETTTVEVSRTRFSGNRRLSQAPVPAEIAIPIIFIWRCLKYSLARSSLAVTESLLLRSAPRLPQRYSAFTSTSRSQTSWRQQEICAGGHRRELPWRLGLQPVCSFNRPRPGVADGRTMTSLSRCGNPNRSRRRQEYCQG